MPDPQDLVVECLDLQVCSEESYKRKEETDHVNGVVGLCHGLGHYDDNNLEHRLQHKKFRDREDVKIRQIKLPHWSS
jgi:hypothetical protein